MTLRLVFGRDGVVVRGRNPPEEEETEEVRESRVLGVWESSNQEPVEEMEEAVSERSGLMVNYVQKLRVEGRGSY